MTRVDSKRLSDLTAEVGLVFLSPRAGAARAQCVDLLHYLTLGMTKRRIALVTAGACNPRSYKNDIPGGWPRGSIPAEV
jgi:hypothetical protein